MFCSYYFGDLKSSSRSNIIVSIYVRNWSMYTTLCWVSFWLDNLILLGLNDKTCSRWRDRLDGIEWQLTEWWKSSNGRWGGIKGQWEGAKGQWKGIKGQWGGILKKNEEGLMGHKRRYRATGGVIGWERGIKGLWALKVTIMRLRSF